MEIILQESDEEVRISVHGDIDMSDIKAFKEKSFEIGRTSEKDLIIDFKGVGYIDSSGIGILLTLNKMQKGKGRAFRLVNCSENIERILELSSLSGILGKE